MLHHERNVDGEFAVAFDELARAVQGIDDPQLAPVHAFGPGRLRRLLGENRNVGGKLGQALDDVALRLQVRQGERRIVLFTLHREVPIAVDAHDGLAGAGDDGQEGKA